MTRISRIGIFDCIGGNEEQQHSRNACERGADKAGKDANGRIMGAIATKLSDDQMKAVADYMAGLRN